jgi:hypothetical protein
VLLLLLLLLFFFFAITWLNSHRHVCDASNPSFGTLSNTNIQFAPRTDLVVTTFLFLQLIPEAFVLLGLY